MSDLMRLAGINSGYDSEAMIEQLLKTYQARIDTQNKKLTKLTWKQDAYRDVISKLTAFKNKYFDILKRDHYLLSPTSFKKFKATVTNKSDPSKVGGISVTTSANSVAGSHNVKITQTATAAKLTGNTLSSQNFKLDLNRAAECSHYTVEETENEDGTVTSTRKYSFSMDVKVGDIAKSIDFEVDILQDEEGNINMEDFASSIEESLNDVLEDAFGLTGKSEGDSGVTGGLNADGKERFLSVKAGEDGKMELLVGGNANVTISEKTGDFGLARFNDRLSIAAQACVTGTNSVSVTVNGVKKKVKDEEGNETEVEVSVTKKVSFEGVSDTYFDTRNEKGNEEILAQYNELKIAAYKKSHWGLPPTAAQLASFSYTSAQAAKDLNSKTIENALNEAFKEDGVKFSYDEDGYLNNNVGEFSMTAVDGGTLGISKGFATSKITTSHSLKELGFAGKDEDVTLKINGEEITVNSSASLNDLIKAVNASNANVTMMYSNLEGRLIVTSNDMGDGGDVNIEANEFAAALGLATDAETAMEAKGGTNAIIEIDGVEIYHNSNSYTFDGTTINFSDAELGSEYTIGISQSYDDIKQAIKDFVADYNQLIDDIYEYTATAPKRDNKNNLYEPLTDEEKAEMSEKEIEKWEDAAKQGILYNDSTVSSIMSNLRMVLYNSVETDDGGKFNLVSMGISTMTYKENAHGKLEIDEEAFDKAFEEHADDIMKLFTDTETGIMTKVNNTLDNAVKTTGTVKGSLVRKAGLKDSSTAKDNEIYRQMEQINKRIQTLQDRYTAKENYWWKIFTNLEKMMASMNEQSSYLANYFGYTGNYQ